MRAILSVVSGLLLCASAVPMAPAQQQSFPVVQTVNAPTIAGRNVQLDAQGKLLPWPMADSTGYSYSDYFLTQWTIVWDQYNRQRLPYFYCCFNFDRTTFAMEPDRHWANSTGYLRAMMEGFVERLYPYTGDPHTLEFLEDFADYELDHGLTPADYAYPQVPYPSADPGAENYSGWSEHGKDFVEPHVIGEDGYAYLRLYEMTGNTRYLQEAIRCAHALVKNYKPGNATVSPWPYRCRAKDGNATTAAGKGMFPYSANVVEPIMLFDELMRLHQGDVADYARVRAAAWQWLLRYPMQNNVWVGYFEDVLASMDSMNNVIPLELARYLLLHPEKDPQWRQHARKLIDWVKSTPKWPKYDVHGALVTTEQGSGHAFCCNQPNECCDSHSSRLAATEAFYYAATGDADDKQAAYRTWNWVTYWQGLPARAHAPFANQWWFTDEFADGPRRMMDAFWAVPEWAPADESHFLGSLSVVTKIAYGPGSVTYSDFDADATDVLRLNFVPRSVMVGGRPIARVHKLRSDSYIFDDATHVLRIRHARSGNVDIQGDPQLQPPPRILTFDDPHLAAGTVLVGQYPSGIVDWGASAWKIGAPFGKFGTFNLELVNPKTGEADFSFYAPRIFVGIDVYNDGPGDATVSFASPETGESSFTLRPGELRRIRTGWRAVSSRVHVTLTNGAGLRFDNLAWLHP
jgi:hypothetical protein